MIRLLATTPKDNMRNYAIKVAQNQVTDFLRKQNAKCRGVAVSYDTLVKTNSGDVFFDPPCNEDTLADLCRDVDQDALMSAVQQLTPVYQETIKAVLQCDSRGDAAQMLGVPSGTVGSRLTHIIKRLRQIFYEQGVAA